MPGAVASSGAVNSMAEQLAAPNQNQPNGSRSQVMIRFSAGADNVSPEYALSDNSVRDMVNVAVDRSGGIRVRNGLRALSAGTYHSLFSLSSGGYLVVDGGSLLHVKGGVVTAVESVSAHGRVRYCERGDEVFWTDGQTTGRVVASGSGSFWGLSCPPTPVITTTQGALSAGRYLISHTAVCGGVESGAPTPTLVELTSTGGLVYMAPKATAGISFNVYLSPPSGAVSDLRRVASGVMPETTTILRDKEGMRLRSFLAEKPYPGQLLADHGGRLWIASGATLWFTDSESPHWLFPSEGYFLLPEPITLLVSVEDGLFVGSATQTWFLRGTRPSDMSLQHAAPFGAVLGTGTTRVPFDIFGNDGAPCAVWIDSVGVLCLGRMGGSIKRITENRYRIGPASSGEIAFGVFSGVRQLLVLLDAPRPGVGARVDTPISVTYNYGLT